MAAFKPKSATLAPPADPKSREDFIAIFGQDTVTQCERILFDAIQQVNRGRAYFRERDIVNAAEKMGGEELPQPVLRNQHFVPLLQFIFRNQSFHALDTRGVVTTEEMWNKEQHMLAMAGEPAPVHQLPEKIVDEALATRSWIDPKDIPTEFLEGLKQEFPRADVKALENRLVVAAAEKLGCECYGVDFTWNRPGASSLSDDLIGSSSEFAAAIEDAKAAGESWFVKPVVFISDDWSSPEALKLKKAAEDAPHPVLFLTRSGISDEQVAAVIAATLLDRRVTVIEGTAGAGKSFTMKSVCEAYMAMGYDVMGAALGWSAAKVLSGSTGLPEKSCRAMEGFLRSMRKAQVSGAEFFSRPTLIIVDEAGMVGTRHMHDLLEMTRNSRYPIKIVLTGDSLQVAPVDAGNALEAIIEFHGTVRIDTIRRQKQASHRLAVKRFSLRHSGEALYPFVHQEAVRWSEDKENMFNKVVRDFVSYRAAFPDKKALVLALKNDDVTELNRRIRLVYKKAGFIEPQEVRLDVTDGRASWKAGFSIGDEVVLRSNDQNLPTYHIPKPGTADLYDERTWEFKTTGVFNRNAGRIVGIRYSDNPAGSTDFIIDMEGDDPARVIVNSKKFKHENRSGMPMVHNFATTIYASQGQTVNKVLLIDSDRMNFRLSYVGMSRHTESVDIYLNETDLHLRLDRMMGKSPSKPVGDVDPDLLGVELGRYSRSEMLQTVALCWGQDSSNLTATIYSRRRKFVKEHKDESPEELARIRKGSANDPVIDFIPSINVPYPMVDIEKILSLPDPIEESEFVRPSDVEENRASISIHESPVHVNSEVLPALKPLRQEGEGIFSRAVGWMKDLAKGPPESVPSASRRPTAAEAAGHAKPAEAFHSRDGRTDQKAVSPAADKDVSLLKKATDFVASLTPKPKGLKAIPLLPLEPPVGSIDAQGVLRFDNVPQTLAPADGSPIPVPSDEFLVSPQAKLWWDVGRGGEPRILARSNRGEVTARYSLDGRCVVGEGFPPIAYASKPSPETPIHIVPGAREWFLLQEMYHQKYKDMPEKEPHVVWGAHEVDWKHVAKGMRGRKVFIVRSRHDEGQIPWALSLEKELRERWKLDATIVPKLPEADLASEEPAAAPSRPGPGGRRRP